MLDNGRVIKKQLFFIVNGNQSIGMGHVMRCLGLADAAKERKLESCFVTHDKQVEDLATSKNHHVIVLPITSNINDEITLLEHVLSIKDCCVILDRYDYSTEAIKLIKMSSNAPIVVIDDLNDRELCVDLIINPNIGGEYEIYVSSCSSIAKVKAGGQYFLLRKELANIKNTKTVTEFQNVLLTSGSTDLNGSLLRILKVLVSLELKQSIFVLIGPEFKNIQQYIEIAKNQSNVQLVCNNESIGNMHPEINTTNLEQIYVKMDGAFATTSTSCFELMACGIPVIGFSMVDNQKNNFKNLSELGLIIPLTNEATLFEHNIANCYEKLLTLDVRKLLIQKGLEMIDGKGISRVLDAIEELII